MIGKINVLFAVRDSGAAEALRREMDDEENCTFHIVHSGQAALEAAGRFLPDILVVDAVLPGMDGIGLMDCFRMKFGERAPRVIAGAMTRFSREGFLRRGAAQVVRLPWGKEELRSALLVQMENIETRIDWDKSKNAHDCASRMLMQMGMSPALKGCEYLAWAAALAYENDARLYAVGRRLYAPIAERFSAAPENIERLIRHAIESTMNTSRARGVYMFFGNTIDPKRGKPTNAQVIALLAQRMRASSIDVVSANGAST